MPRASARPLACRAAAGPVHPRLADPAAHLRSGAGARLGAAVAPGLQRSFPAASTAAGTGGYPSLTINVSQSLPPQVRGLGSLSRMFQSAIQLERQLSGAQSSPLELAVVVPTLNESGNIAEFLSLLEVALVGVGGGRGVGVGGGG